MDTKKNVLVVAGLDPSGGAGLLADCAAIRAAGCLPFGVPSVMTVQDGIRFISAEPVDIAYILSALRVLWARGPIGAVKIGALKSGEIVEGVSRFLRDNGAAKVVVDPVMVSTSGGRLLDEDATAAMISSLFPCATLVTPNLAEASLLADMPVRDIEEMQKAATRILAMGPGAVLIKGGHLEGEGATDVFADGTGPRILKTEKKIGEEVRGTGCALSSLIAAWLAREVPIIEAIEKSRDMLGHAIRNAYSVGDGPLLLGEFA